MSDKADDDISNNRDDGHEEGIDDEVREGFSRPHLHNTLRSACTNGQRDCARFEEMKMKNHGR